MDPEIDRYTNIPSEIEVNWELPDRRRVWWRARVTSLRLQSVLKDHQNAKVSIDQATAMLHYEAGHGFGASTYHVRFKTQNLLEHTGLESESSLSSWRMPRWVLARVRDQPNAHKNGARVVRKATMAKNTSLRSRLYTEIDTLRNGVVRNSARLDLIESAFHCRIARELIDCNETSFMRAKVTLGFVVHRLALGICKSPGAKFCLPSNEYSHSLVTGAERGIRRSIVQVVADCELGEFETIAKMVQSKSKYLETTPLFLPSYELTQLPCVGTNNFSITVDSFADLCRILGIMSTSDRMRMLRTYGKRKGEGTMRILGAYRIISDLQQQSSEFFIGRSILQCSISSDLGTAISSSALYGIVTRDTSSWNPEDRTYQHPLKIENRRLPTQVKHMGRNNKDRIGNFFELRWQRAGDVSPRIWSHGIARSDIVVGKLEVIVPCIIMHGSLLCDEYTTLLTETALKSV